MTIINTDTTRSLRRSLRTASRLLSDAIDAFPYVAPAQCANLLEALVETESALEQAVTSDSEEVV